MSWQSALAEVIKGRTSAAKVEHAMLDFKTEKPDAKAAFQDLAEAAVCFANATGGTLVVGVADTGTGASALVGARLSADAIRSGIYERTEPPLLLACHDENVEGRRLVVIHVPPGESVHSTKGGHYARRVGTQCLPMRADEVARVQEERSRIDWSASASPESFDAVSSRALSVAFDLLRSSRRPAHVELSRLAPRDLLRQIGVLLPDGSLTRAGALLFCGPRSTGAPDVLVYQYRATRGGEAIAVRRWQTPLLTAHREVLESIDGRLTSKPITARSGQQFLLDDFPREAIREAVTNALVHGDLREGRPVQIEHSPELFRVVSPGPLVSGITPDNLLTHPSKPRFAALARAMTTLTLTETLGQGFDRMFREMIRSGRSIPEVVEHPDAGGRTEVTLRGGPANVRLAKFIADLEPSERDDTDALLITYTLCERKTVNANAVSPLIQRSVAEAQDVLRRLAHGESAILEATAGTSGRRQPNYRLRSHALAALGSTVTYHRRTTTETDRKVIGHVKDYGTINNAAVQRLFDLDVWQARDVLADLVGRELLVRVSEQKRGPAVKYGPGPLFGRGTTRRTRPTSD